ncbi:hypothetical protein MPSEU_000849500 [Mayamaea pseudoterrestris]|nr:hypothetical protein MPSEU_000849500 [Mayamaea pseudoterrestris]
MPHPGIIRDRHAHEAESLLAHTHHLHHPLHESLLKAKRRRRLTFSLLAFFLVLMVLMTIGYVQAKNNGGANMIAPSATSSELLNARATKALDQLNKLWKKNIKKKKKKKNVSSNSCETTIILLRHCEKQGPGVFDHDGNEHCSYLGYQRAEYLVDLFTGKTAKWPLPSFLMAYVPDRGSGHWNFREYETLVPLSSELQIAIDLVKQHDAHTHLLELIANREVCDKVIAISWKHEIMPWLAASLGCGPQQGCPIDYPDDEFDQVWQLKYVLHDDNAGVARQEDRDGAGDRAGDDENVDKSELEDESSIIDEEQDHDGHRARSLRRHSKQTRNSSSSSGWYVYGSTVYQNFDPLAFSMSRGKYGGRPDESPAPAAAAKSASTATDNEMGDEI